MDRVEKRDGLLCPCHKTSTPFCMSGISACMTVHPHVYSRVSLTPAQVEPPVMNAVIMGRKTWESIPPKFRPLKGRLNVVISRSFGSPAEEPASVETEPVKASSLEQAIAYLQGKPQGSLGRVLVIGGGQIYTAALELKEAKRVLLTKVMTDFECDTFFSLKLNDEGESSPGWTKRSKAELDTWTGEVVPEGTQVENDTSYEFQMWERTD